MEEEIKVLEEFVKENRNWHCIECGYNCEKNMKTEQAIENLINKYKELEKERDSIYADYQDLGKQHLELLNKYEELEKIVEAMAYEISEEDENYQYLSTKEITEHFTKKVRGELKWGYIKP